ncbi:VIT1/CCC1 transporter family protein [Aquirhabdus parva]|uniref:VIT family protein n=1 Tax=Aquirhabdus parva TaxID=2283318 RepID=A0A345PA01_9GAMM|nr:VIT family protein [Aquirhabdus parva]AXI04110.1 VIT family protein [Aquirhabdus parva]
MSHAHHEVHYSNRTGWLRASVLGANDGILSVASLVIGVAASGAAPSVVLLTGIAGLVSGALSMAAGEYVSVQSQADTEQADLVKEQAELKRNPQFELKELTQIYVERGLTPTLAHEVAVQLTEKNALEAHARDEIGLSETLAAQPIHAAMASALSFTVGAIFPIVAAWLSPAHIAALVVGIVSTLALMISGGLSSYAGGVPLYKGIVRVTIGGILAMLVTAWIGSLFGTHV